MGLELFVAVMWAMVLAVSAFLVLFVAHLDIGQAPRILDSAVQAALAMAAIVLFVLGLSRLKRAYVKSKLG